MRINTVEVSNLSNIFFHTDINKLDQINFDQAMSELHTFKSEVKFIALLKLHHHIKSEFQNPTVSFIDNRLTLIEGIDLKVTKEYVEVNLPTITHVSDSVAYSVRALHNTPKFANWQDFQNYLHKPLTKDSWQTFQPFNALLNLEVALATLANFFISVHVTNFNVLQSKSLAHILNLYRLSSLNNKSSSLRKTPLFSDYLLNVKDDVLKYFNNPESSFYISESEWDSYFKKVRCIAISSIGLDPKLMQNYFTSNGFEANQYLDYCFKKNYPDAINNLCNNNSRKLEWVKFLYEAKKSDSDFRPFLRALLEPNFWESGYCLNWIKDRYNDDYGLLQSYFDLPEPIYQLITHDKVLKSNSLKFPVSLYNSIIDNKIDALEQNIYLIIRHALYVANHLFSKHTDRTYSFDSAVFRYCLTLIKVYGKNLDFKSIVTHHYKHFDILVSPIFKDIVNRFDFLNGISTHYYAELLEHKPLNYVLAVYNSESEAKAKALNRKTNYKKFKSERERQQNLQNRIQNDENFRSEWADAMCNDQMKRTGSRLSNDKTHSLRSHFINLANKR